MSIQIINKEFTDLDNQLGTPTSFLIGNIGDRYEAKIDFSYSVLKEYDLGNTLLIDTFTDATGTKKAKLINTDGQEWHNLGFQVGNATNPKIAVLNYTLYVAGVGTVQTIAANVLSINGDEMVVDHVYSAGSTVLPSTNDGSGNYVADVRVYAVLAPEQIVASVFHTLNSTNQTTSYIDGTIPNISFDGVDNMLLNSTITGTLTGKQGGAGLFGTPKLKYTGSNGINRFYSLYFKNYLLPFIDHNDLETNTTPAQYLAQECLTDKIIIEGRPEKRNPNIKVPTEVFDTLGNTGYFGETFNGLHTDITATISYEDEATGTALNTINSAGNTKFTITVSGVNVGPQSAVGLGFALMPSDLSDIQFTNTTGHHNLNLLRISNLYSTTPVIAYQLGSGDYAMAVKDYKVSVSGSDMIVTGVFSPSSQLLNYLSTAAEDDRKYIVFASAESISFDILNTDKTSVLCDFNAMQEYIAPVGAWGHDIGILSRTQENTESETSCNIDVRTEDIVKLKSDFLIGSTIPDSLIYRVVAYNSSTGLEYDLDRIEFDFSPYPVVGGIPQISISQNRGYNVPNVEDYTISIERNATLDAGGSYGYTAVIPLLVRYEDWISRLGAPSDFYDNAELNDGFNNKWYHYLSTTGWEIRLVLNTDTTVAGTTFRYQDYKTLGFNDYDANSIISSAITYYRDSDNQLLTGGGGLGVIMDEDVRVECIFTRSTGAWVSGDLSNLYSWVRVEVDGGGGHLTAHEINNTDIPLTTSALAPVSGQTKLKVELLNSTQIKVSCLVKPNKLETASRYKVSARLKCK